MRRLLPALSGALLLSVAAGAAEPPTGPGYDDADDRGEIPQIYVRPVYPEGVTVSGSCGAFFDVQPDGAVDMSTLSVACANPVFTASVKHAIALWHFKPTLINGEPVAQIGYSARIMFTGGNCARVVSGNDIDTPCALSQQ
jgi:hypothetical protein